MYIASDGNITIRESTKIRRFWQNSIKLLLRREIFGGSAHLCLATLRKYARKFFRDNTANIDKPGATRMCRIFEESSQHSEYAQILAESRTAANIDILNPIACNQLENAIQYSSHPASTKKSRKSILYRNTQHRL